MDMFIPRYETGTTALNPLAVEMLLFAIIDLPPGNGIANGFGTQDTPVQTEVECPTRVTVCSQLQDERGGLTRISREICLPDRQRSLEGASDEDFVTDHCDGSRNVSPARSPAVCPTRLQRWRKLRDEQIWDCVERLEDIPRDRHLPLELPDHDDVAIRMQRDVPRGLVFVSAEQAGIDPKSFYLTGTRVGLAAAGMPRGPAAAWQNPYLVALGTSVETAKSAALILRRTASRRRATERFRP